jgi:rod shape-determining protein MreC
MLTLHNRVVTYCKDLKLKKIAITELNKKVINLEAENSALRAENTALMATVSYVDEVSDLITFKQHLDHRDDIIAQIIARYITDDQHYILVDAGLSSGITNDMIVSVDNNVIGRVVAVYAWYSKVQLITDPKSCISAYMVKTKAQGMHKGMGTLEQTKVERVSHLDTLVVGDDVFTSGEGLIFPRGYRIGTVISKVPAGLYYEVCVKPAVDPHSLRYCLIHGRT